MPDRRSSLGMAGDLGVVERPLDLAPERGQLAELRRLDREARPRPPAATRRSRRRRRRRPPSRPRAVVDLDAAREHVGGDVAERRPPRPRRPRIRTRAPTRPDGHVDRELELAVGGRLDAPRLDRPGRERDRAVPARRREAVLVPEQHARARRRRRRAGRGSRRTCRRARAARGRAAAARAGPPGSPSARARRSATVAPGSSGRALEHDPERLAGRVVVRRAHLHGRGRYHARAAPRGRAGARARRRRAPRAATARRRSAAARRRRRRTRCPPPPPSSPASSSAPRTAIPIASPIWRAVLLSAEARPPWAGGSTPRCANVVSGFASPTPTPGHAPGRGAAPATSRPR